MPNLLETNPQALDFCQSVVDNADDYRLNEFEIFDDLWPCVLATTSIDSHNEAFALSSLERLVEYVANNPYWLGVEHDPLIHPQGRIIAAKIFHSPDVDVFFVAGVIGSYGIASIKSFKDVGISTFDYGIEAALEKGKDVQLKTATLACNPIEVDYEIIKEWMDSRPQLVEKEIRRSIRKELEPIAIVTLIVSSGLFLKPFFSKIGEKLGDKSAEEISRFYDWLKTTVFKTVKKIKNERFRFGFLFEYEGTIVEFVVPSKDEALLSEATDNIGAAYALATNLIEKLREFEPQKLILEFDLRDKTWKPSYLATKRIGIISDRPTLGALDKMQGLSVGGIVANENGNTMIK